MGKLFLLLFICGIGIAMIYQSPPITDVISPTGIKQTLLSTITPTVRPNPTLSTIFGYLDPLQQVKNVDSTTYTIVATGDVIPARSVNAQVVGKNNFIFPFEKTASLLKTADAVFINLETPLITHCPVTIEGMIFCGDQRHIEGLTFAGVTVVSIANNHAGNYGFQGVENTVKLLQEHAIQVTGHGSPAIIRIRDKTFGFLGYNDIGHQEHGIAWAENETIIADIQQLNTQVDFIFVAFHWGEEYTSTANARQRELARLSIDAGADVIIGNHPHWVQGVEMYKGKFITYAHGNYVFDQMWSRETTEGVLGKYVFDNQGLITVNFFPIIIENYSQPRFATQAEAQAILVRMKRESTVTESVPE